MGAVLRWVSRKAGALAFPLDLSKHPSKHYAGAIFPFEAHQHGATPTDALPVASKHREAGCPSQGWVGEAVAKVAVLPHAASVLTTTPS